MFLSPLGLARRGAAGGTVRVVRHGRRRQATNSRRILDWFRWGKGGPAMGPGSWIFRLARPPRAQACHWPVLSPSLSPQHGYLESKASINNILTASALWSSTRCSARNVLAPIPAGPDAERCGRRHGAGWFGTAGAGSQRTRATSRTGSGEAEAAERTTPGCWIRAVVYCSPSTRLCL